MVDRQVFKGTVVQTNDNGFVLDGWGGVWINYSKPEWYTGLRPVQKGWVIQVTAAESNGRWYASQVEAADGGRGTAQPVPGAPQPAPAPSPAPAPTATSAPPPAPAQPQSYQEYYAAVAGARETPQAEKAAPGSFAYKDSVAIPKAVALNDAKDIIVALLRSAYYDQATLSDLGKVRNATIWLAQSFFGDFLAVDAENEVVVAPAGAQPPPQDGDPGPQQAP